MSVPTDISVTVYKKNTKTEKIWYPKINIMPIIVGAQGKINPGADKYIKKILSNHS